MERSYNNGLVLVRLVGALAVMFGAFGTAFGLLVVALRILGLEGKFLDSLWQEAIRSLAIGPLWLLCGSILMWISPRLARWIAKPCQSSAP